jgi:hypothetical protein
MRSPLGSGAAPVPQGDSNDPRISRRILRIPPQAAQKAAHLHPKSPPLTRPWPRSFTPGQRCPKRSEPASWRWFGRRAGRPPQIGSRNQHRRFPWLSWCRQRRFWPIRGLLSGTQRKVISGGWLVEARTICNSHVERHNLSIRTFLLSPCASNPAKIVGSHYQNLEAM